MELDSHSEVTSQSWFQRIRKSVNGIFLGIILFICGFPTLLWNEGRAVRRDRTLEEGLQSVIPILADSVNPKNEGKLVYLNGRTAVYENLSDIEFGVSTRAIKLRRIVKMLQWKEKKDSKTEKKLGGGSTTKTTYSYQKIWADHVINSSRFKNPEGHQNPERMLYTPSIEIARKVTLGAFSLPSNLVAQIGKEESLSANNSNLPSELRGKVKSYNGGYYIGADPSAPAIGDLEISFSRIPTGDISLVSKQIKNTFTKYKTKSAGNIELLETGIFSPEEMFEHSSAKNRLLTWLFRIVGFILISVGLKMILNPLSVLADVIPLLGTLVGAGTGLVAMSIGGAVSMIVIAIAWFAYRPILGVSLLICAALLFFTLKFQKANNQIGNQ